VTGNLDNLAVGTPIAEAKNIHAKWRESSESLIAACIRIAEVMSVYAEEKRADERSKFVSELIERGVLSKQDGRRPGKSPKLSKLITIGESEYLQDRRVRPLLPPSYSTLYYICQLATHLAKADPPTATSKLVAVLERYKGRLDTRTAIAELNRSRRKVRVRRVPRQPTPAAISALIATNRVFDLVLLTPTPKDIAAFRGGGPDDYLARCLPLTKLIGQPGTKAVVALALEAQHIDVAPLILSLAGRHTFPQSATNRSGLKYSESTVLITSDGISLQSKTADWSNLKAGFRRLLEGAYPELRRRLHVFAPGEERGWTSLIAERSWLEMPP
jgi:hypothetical protein